MTYKELLKQHQLLEKKYNQLWLIHHRVLEKLDRVQEERDDLTILFNLCITKKPLPENGKIRG